MSVIRNTRLRSRSSARGLAASTSLAERAYLAIRDQILRGQLRPGTPVSRRNVAVELGMSVLPVTDALRRLQADGLLETRARAGTRVLVPTEADVRQRYELREALESQSARLFAERSTAAERRVVARRAGVLDASFERLARGRADAARGFAVHQRHVQFHLAIADGARSPLLREMIERTHVLVFNWLFQVTARRTPLPAHFHAELAEALASGDPDGADAAMRAHVRHGLAEVTAHISDLDASEWREPRRRRRR
jgi:DNA-binding GntR family transcriptional regulator